jgi:hypothetical protein
LLTLTLDNVKDWLLLVTQVEEFNWLNNNAINAEIAQ